MTTGPSSLALCTTGMTVGGQRNLRPSTLGTDRAPMAGGARAAFQARSPLWQCEAAGSPSLCTFGLLKGTLCGSDLPSLELVPLLVGFLCASQPNSNMLLLLTECILSSPEYGVPPSELRHFHDYKGLTLCLAQISSLPAFQIPIFKCL